MREERVPVRLPLSGARRSSGYPLVGKGKAELSEAEQNRAECAGAGGTRALAPRSVAQTREGLPSAGFTGATTRACCAARGSPLVTVFDKTEHKTEEVGV